MPECFVRDWCGLPFSRRGLELTSSILEMIVPATAATQDSAEPLNDPAKRRRRWTQEKKWEIVRESFDPMKSLHMVAARYNVNPSQLSRWRRQYRDQILSTTKSGEEGPANTGRTE